jgi:hypothetical protein
MPKLISGMVFALMAAVGAAAEPSPESPFDKLKSLAGEWQAELPGFGTMTNSIRLVSGGKAIEETIGTPAENETSLYTRHDGRILLTHYCAMTPDGHQVRLEAGPEDGTRDRLVFAYVDAINLHSPAAPHMRKVELTIIDADHFTERWTKIEAGKDTVFDLKFSRR